MKKLTSTQRNELRGILAEYAYNNTIGFVATTEIFNLVEKWFSEQQTFSETIIEKSIARRKCNTCGQMGLIYKTWLRKQWMKPLKILSDVGRPMTMTEIAKLMFGDTTKNDAITRTFPQAKHWGIIENIGKSKYVVTELGGRFLGKGIALPEFIWIPARHVEFDTTTLEEAEKVTIDEIQDRKYSDKLEHVLQAA